MTLAGSRTAPGRWGNEVHDETVDVVWLYRET